MLSPLTSTLILAVQATVPRTPNWTWQVGLVMILCNLLAIVIGRFAIQDPGKGPKLPIALPGLEDNFGVPELLATTSFGHLIGAGVILGLSNAGIL